MKSIKVIEEKFEEELIEEKFEEELTVLWK